MLNNKYDIGPEKIEDSMILTVNIISVSFIPKISKEINVIILDNPHLAPGKIASSGLGIYVSIIYNTKLYPTINPKNVNLLVFINFQLHF